MSVLINVYGGPAAGKTTTAATIFAHLKQTGRHAELCLEYAKELVYTSQLHDADEVTILREQVRRHVVYLRGEVDYVVTDAPLLQKVGYMEPCDWPGATTVAAVVERKYARVLHLMLPSPGNEHDMRGRVHTPDESRGIHNTVQMVLDRAGVRPYNVTNTAHALEVVFNFISGGYQ
jgi:RecA/RadA recombinase